MSKPQIFHTEIDELAFLIIDGKGSFKESPIIEQYGKESIDAGKTLHIDLTDCDRMDSTFMGILAKLSLRQKEKLSAKLIVINANKKARNSLNGLGLGVLMDIHSDWGKIENHQIQRLQQRIELCSVPTEVETSHVYDAHSTLCELSEENKNKFSSLMEGLDHEMAND